MSRWLKVVLGVMALFYSIFGMSMETEQAKRSRHFNFLNSCILKKESLVLIKLSELQKKIEKVNKTQKIENDNAITPLISPIETFNKMREELQHMKSVDRPAASRAIGEAREKGDLKENAEYDSAKEAQGY